MSTTWPFAPDLLRDDTSLGTLSGGVVEAVICGSQVAQLTVADRLVHARIARSSHEGVVVRTLVP
jgi:hypothetical protein